MKKIFAFAITAALAILLTGCAGSQTQASTGEYIDDTVITTKVKAALAKSPDTDALDIQVETFKGTVQLSGFVDGEDERIAATRIAADVNGVNRVENRLSLRQEQGG